MLVLQSFVSSEQDPRWNERKKRPYVFFCGDLTENSTCLYATDFKSKIDDHLSRKHQIYPKPFWEKVNSAIGHPYYQYLTRHHGSQEAIYPCMWERCKEKLVSKEDMLVHIRETHDSVLKLEDLDGIPSLLCDYCDTTFANLKNKRNHIREVRIRLVYCTTKIFLRIYTINY